MKKQSDMLQVPETVVSVLLGLAPMDVLVTALEEWKAEGVSGATKFRKRALQVLDDRIVDSEAAEPHGWAELRALLEG